MTLHVKHTDGTWHTPAPGKVLYRIPGPDWFAVGKVWSKDETEVWKSSGYLGPPGAPLNLAVRSWTYSRLVVDWDPPTTVVRPTRYLVQLLPASGSMPISQIETAYVSAAWNVNEETRYRVRVASIGSSATSEWTELLRVQIGRPLITREVLIPKERPWSDTVEVNMFRGENWGNVLPQNVRATDLRVNLVASWPVPRLCYADSTQEIHKVRHGELAAGLGTRDNPLRDTLDLTQNISGLHGLRCVGSTWSVRGESRAHRVTGTITSIGIETYMVESTEVVQTEIKNSYW